MSSPWGNVAKVVPVNFHEIMSEQLACDLQDKEFEKYKKIVIQQEPHEPKLPVNNETNNVSNNQEVQTTPQTEEKLKNVHQIVDVTNNVEEEEEVGGGGGAAAVAVAGTSSNRIRSSSSSSSSSEENVNWEEEKARYEQYLSDIKIAKMLQDECDRENDNISRLAEKHLNKDSKIKISYAKFRTISDDCNFNVYDDDEEDEQLEPDDPQMKKDWDRFETNEKIFDGMSKKGFTYDKDGIKITKHDEKINGVRNACRVMSFPPEFQTGDTAGFDMRLPNGVFNQLKTYSQKSKKNKANNRRENEATAVMGIDQKTSNILLKLIHNQILDKVYGVISTGKEAIILHATTDPTYEGELILPKECAIKVFKTTLNEFKQRDRYIKDDYRFKGRFRKQNNRTVINMWAEKEMHNLIRLRNFGVPCPTIIELKKHTLVMSFIGEAGVAAPKLKDVILSPADTIIVYEQVLEIMNLMYKKAKLVHADLSEYNILWHDNKCWFIDVAQSVEPDHPSAFEFLMRDCDNISTFFTRRGVPNVKSKEEIFTSITGLDSFTHNATMLERIHVKGPTMAMATVANTADMPEHIKPITYPFDYAWEKSQQKIESQ